MKYVAYILFVAAAIHAFGSIVGHSPEKIVVSVLIGGIGAIFLVVAKKRAKKTEAK